MRRWQQRVAIGFIAAHVVFAVALNYLVVMPVLQRFDREYGATMRTAADELAKDTQGGTNRRVLVMVDIGVLSLEANGRFEIYDGGALATPSLLGLGLRDELAQVKPAYVVQSLAETPEGWGPAFADQLSAVWKRRFRQLSVGQQTPYYYTIIYRDKEQFSEAAGADGMK